MGIPKGEIKMQKTAIKGKIERRIISISMKRQLTIPQKYFSVLGFDNEAECILQDGCLLIRPVHNTDNSAFSEQILSDLIAQGYKGQVLLRKFKEQSRAIRPAVLKLIEEADAFTKSGKGCIPMNKLFGKPE